MLGMRCSWSPSAGLCALWPGMLDCPLSAQPHPTTLMMAFFTTLARMHEVVVAGWRNNQVGVRLILGLPGCHAEGAAHDTPMSRTQETGG